MQQMFQMINYESVLVLLVGATIGYTTNWLAIKMIFRPHEPKYIFGIKIPFTPGLISKERKRISKNIGKTIEDNVLTKEDLNEFLKEAKIEKNIQQLMLDYIKENKNVTLKSFLEDKFNTNIDEQFKNAILTKLDEYSKSENVEEICNTITENILNYVKNENITQEIKHKGEEIIKDLLDNILIYFNSDEFSKITKDNLEIVLKNLENSDYTLEERFENIDLEVKLHIKTNLSMYTDIISNYLTSNDSAKFHEELKHLLEKIIKSNINPMIMGFINLDSMYQTGIYKFSEYLKNENNRAEILYYIDGMVNKLFEQKISTIINNLPTEAIKNEITKSVIKTLNNEQLKILLTDKIALDENYIENVIYENRDEINTTIYKIIKNVVENNLDEISEYLKCRVLELKIFKIINENSFIFTSIKNVDNYIFNAINFVVDKIEISSIIEDKLNEIEIGEIEKMILSVAHRELSYITMLGGLLGFIIAGITVFF